jgi:hypothetical protein
VINILIHPAGQWWFKRGLFLEKGKALGGHVCDGWEGCVKEIGFADPYRMAVHNILEGSLSATGYKGVTVFRTFGPDHFEDGRWDTGGKCARTSPGGVPVSFLTEWMYGIQKEQFLNVTGMHTVNPVNPFFLGSCFLPVMIFFNMGTCFVGLVKELSFHST